MSTQWGYLNPETYVAPKPKQVKGLGMLEAKSSEDENEDDDETTTTTADTSMTTKMNTFIDQIQNYENKKIMKIETKRKKREEKEKAKIEPRKSTDGSGGLDLIRITPVLITYSLYSHLCSLIIIDAG